MSDSVTTVVVIFLAGVLMFIFPLMQTAKGGDDISQQLVQAELNDTLHDIITTKEIDLDRYESFTQTISSTGNSYDVEMQVAILDENSNKKTTQTSPTKVGENYSYTEYTTQIMNVLNEKGVYKLKEGDFVLIVVKNNNKTIFQILQNFIYRVTGNGNPAIFAQASGIV